MTEAPRIRLERAGAVARLTLDRPPVNVLDLAALRELNAALESIPAPPEVRFLVFAGAGEKAFSAGVEVRDHTSDRVAEMLGTFHGVFRKLWRSDWITIAAVRGHCLGGGMELASICDFVLATRSARFAQPEIKLACFPPVAAVLLPPLLGTRRALDLILTGRTLTAEQALATGLVTEVVEDSELPKAVESLLATLAALSPAALPITRRAVLQGAGLDFERALDDAERFYLDVLMKTHDAAEGIQAFLEKRAPAWKGR